MDTIKFKLTDECITLGDRKLYRIEALKDFSNVKKGDKGGFVGSEDNLSQENNCWIYDDAKVFGNAIVGENACIKDNARVFENAIVNGNAMISGDAKIYGDALIYENAIVYENAKVYEFAIVDGNAMISGDATVVSDSDYIVFKNWWSSGRHFTWTRSNNMWSVGCFYGTGEELIEKAYKDSKLSGREYKRIVKYVESLKHQSLWSRLYYKLNTIICRTKSNDC